MHPSSRRIKAHLYKRTTLCRNSRTPRQRFLRAGSTSESFSVLQTAAARAPRPLASLLQKQLYTSTVQRNALPLWKRGHSPQGLVVRLCRSRPPESDLECTWETCIARLTLKSQYNVLRFPLFREHSDREAVSITVWICGCVYVEREASRIARPEVNRFYYCRLLCQHKRRFGYWFHFVYTATKIRMVTHVSRCHPERAAGP